MTGPSFEAAFRRYHAGAPLPCWGRPDAPVHRTPATVRAELEEQL